MCGIIRYIPGMCIYNTYRNSLTPLLKLHIKSFNKSSIYTRITKAMSTLSWPIPWEILKSSEFSLAMYTKQLLSLYQFSRFRQRFFHFQDHVIYTKRPLCHKITNFFFQNITSKGTSSTMIIFVRDLESKFVYLGFFFNVRQNFICIQTFYISRIWISGISHLSSCLWK